MVKAVVGADGVTISETTTETSTETATEEVNNMEVQIDDEIDEDDCERYSPCSLSSAEDENSNAIDGSRQVNVLKTACSKDDVDCNNDFKTQSNDHSCSGAAPDSTTSPPPDVIMHHNNHDIIKRKSSRRSRRKRRSSSAAAAVSDPDVQMTPAIGTVGEEESLEPSPSLPSEAQMNVTSTVIDTTNKDNTNIKDCDDDATAEIVGINTADAGTTVVETTSANDDSEQQSMAMTTLQSQQVGLSPDRGSILSSP